MPQLVLEDDQPLKVVEEIKLLGVVVSSDISWRSNTDYICLKSYAKLWMLRRLKPLGASTVELIDVYKKQIMCSLEFSVPV